jgi:hypothetical protein
MKTKQLVIAVLVSAINAKEKNGFETTINGVADAGQTVFNPVRTIGSIK